MTLVLWRKLLRDFRVALISVSVLLCLFQILWAKVVERVLGKLAPFFSTLASFGGLEHKDVQAVVFDGPGRVLKTIIGGDRINLDNAADMLSIGLVHPTVQFILCIWAVGRAAGAIAGEIDRGTMELLLAQPLARSRLVLAHLLFDVVAIPTLCVSMYAGVAIGAWLITPIKVEEPVFPVGMNPAARSVPLFKLGPVTIGLDDSAAKPTGNRSAAQEEAMRKRLAIDATKFLPPLWVMTGLLFALTGVTMWISSAGRFRWRVLGVAVSVVLLQFLVNLLGQMWDQAAWLRPLTVFYYYQPQQMVLSGDATVPLVEWFGPDTAIRLSMPAVLFGVGAFGYAMALRTLLRRDLPAPL